MGRRNKSKLMSSDSREKIHSDDMSPVAMPNCDVSSGEGAEADVTEEEDAGLADEPSFRSFEGPISAPSPRTSESPPRSPPLETFPPIRGLGEEPHRAAGGAQGPPGQRKSPGGSGHRSHSGKFSQAGKENAGSPSQRGLAATSSRWKEVIAEASTLENEAIQFDVEANAACAAECYRRMAAKYQEAALSLPADHSVRGTMEKRAEEATNRAVQLESGSHGLANEECLREVRLDTQGRLASTFASEAMSSTTIDAVTGQDSCEALKLKSAAAAVGGATGLLLMGPVSAVAVGAAAAYAATREDQVGATTRKVGAKGLEVADIAMNTSLQVADELLEEGRKRLLQGSCTYAAHKDKLTQAAQACAAVQKSLPSRKLCEEAKRMRARYPDRVPVICERAPRSELPCVEKKKFCVPGTMLCGEFKYIVHKQVASALKKGVTMDQTIYIFVNGISPKTATTMSQLYEQHKAEDGFLYVRYTAENTLGSRCELI